MFYQPGVNAETIIDVLRERYGIGNILVQFSGAFKKNYEREIKNYEEVVHTLQKYGHEGAVILFVLSRNGFYDTLPEALFHETDRFIRRKENEIPEFNQEFEAQVHEVTNARRFFMPFENHLFHTRLVIHRLFNDMYHRSYEFLADHMFDLPAGTKMKPYYVRLMEILIFYSSVKTHPDRITRAMEYIFDSRIDVKHKKVRILQSFDSLRYRNFLGSMRISENSLCGRGAYIIQIIRQCTLFVDDYMLRLILHGDEFNKFFDCLKDFLFPVSDETEISIKALHLKSFCIGRQKGGTMNCYLGYNTKL